MKKKIDDFLIVQSLIDQKRLIFEPKPKNWVGLTVVNVRTVKNALKLNENVMQNYFSIGY